MLARASPVLAAYGPHVVPRPEGRQVAQIRVREQHDVAAAAAVAAVGPSARDVLLAAEAQPAVASAPRADADAGAVVKHRAAVSR
jgi:hypothetical protein